MYFLTKWKKSGICSDTLVYRMKMMKFWVFRWQRLYSGRW